MPLASVEEWRAHIGSSWCALGRPFYKRIRRHCSGGAKVLSLHHLASMAIFLSLLVWISVALKELKVRGYDPWTSVLALSSDVLDFIPVASVHLCSLAVILWHLSLAVMQTACLLLPQAIKTSLKHYALELYESLQLMFLMAQPSYECMTFIVVLEISMLMVHVILLAVMLQLQLSLTEWIVKFTRKKCDLMFEFLSERWSAANNTSTCTILYQCTRIVVVILSLSVGAVMSVVAAAVIVSHLLRSGDVKMNLGPDSVILLFVLHTLFIDYLLRSLGAFAFPVMVHNRQLVMNTTTESPTTTDSGLTHGDIIAIASTITIAVVAIVCSGTCFVIINKCHSKIKGLCTRIRRQKKLSDKPTCNDFKSLCVNANLAEKWYDFLGYELGLDEDTVDNVWNKNKEDPCKYMMAILDTWVNSEPLEPTYGKLIESLQAIGMEDIAESFCNQKGFTMVPTRRNHEQPSDKPTLHDLQSIIYVDADIWWDLGKKLGLDEGTLSRVRNQHYKDRHKYMMRTLHIWLKSTTLNPTYEHLIDALEATGMGDRAKSVCKQKGIKVDQWRGYRWYVEDLYNDLTPISNCGEQWPPPDIKQEPAKTKFFRLTMIKEETEQNDECINLRTAERLGNALKDKEIKLHDLFQEMDSNRKIVLIYGAPGSGKSTLSTHITQKCLKKEIFSDYELVILVRLRDPAYQKEKTIDIADLLPGRDQEMKKKAAEKISCKDGLGILFVLDGWDELDPDLRTNSIFYNLIKSEGRMLHKSGIIITSRPIASGDIHHLASIRVELVGFDEEEMEKYFTERLNPNPNPNTEVPAETMVLLQGIKNKPAVWGSCYLPLNATILVYIIKHNKKTLPTTRCEIFTKLILIRINRHYKLRKDLPPTFDKLPNEGPFMDLCKIAYEKTMDNKVSFSDHDLPQGKETLSLVQCERSLTDCGGEKMYYNFIHLSVQEVLTAHYIVTKLPVSEQVSKFNIFFSSSRFSAVFQFYAAMTRLQTPGMSDFVQKVAKKCAVEYPKKSDQTLLVALLNCLFEAQDSSLCTTVAAYFSSKLNLERMKLSAADCLSVGYFLSHTKSFYVNLNHCSIGDDGAKLLFKCGNTYDLQVLRLCDNKIGSNGAKAISSALKTMTSLEVLDLSNNEISDLGAIKALFSAISTMTSLMKLCFNSNCIGNKGAGAISITMMRMINLTAIELCHNQIGSDGAKAISSALKTMTNLEVLDLRSNHIGDDGVKAISSAMKRMISLRVIQLGSNRSITSKGVNYLKKAKETKDGYQTTIWMSIPGHRVPSIKRL